MTPPPSPALPPQELNKDAIPPSSFYGHRPPPKRAGSGYTTYQTLPPASIKETLKRGFSLPDPPSTAAGVGKRSRAPSPELPPYSPTAGPFDDPSSDYKPPEVLPPSPDEPPRSLLDDPNAYEKNVWEWGPSDTDRPGWGPPQSGLSSGGRIGEDGWADPQPRRGGSPSSMLASGRQSPEAWELGEAFQAMEDDDGQEPLATQYGDGLVQEKLVQDLCSWGSRTYTPAVERGREVGELWNITVVRVPEVPPPPVPATVPGTPVVLSSSASMTSIQSAVSAPAATSSQSTETSETSTPASTDPPTPTTSTPPAPPAPTQPLHPHNPPTLHEVRALLPYPLHLSIPFLPHAWLPLIVSDKTYPPLDHAPPWLLPEFPPSHPSCSQQPHRAHHLHTLPQIVQPSSALRLPPPSSPPDPETPPPLLDLHFCCLCKLHVLAPSPSAHPSLPTVIPPPLWGAYLEDRMRSPPPGMRGEEAVMHALETMMKMNEGVLWGGRRDCVKVGNKVFGRKVGWNETVAQIMMAMGWTISSESTWLAALNPTSPTSSPAAAASPSPPTLPTAEGQAQVLVPPPHTSLPDSPERNKLLMAWIELGAFALVWKRRWPGMKMPEFRFSLEVVDAREALEDELGVDDLFLHDTPRQIPTNAQQRGPFEALGLGTRWSPKLLKTAYEAQCKCSVARRTMYFDCLSQIYETTQNDAVGVLLAEERSRGRHTTLELGEAYAELGFGEEGEIGMVGEESDDEAVWNAFLYRVGQWGKLSLQSAYAGPYAPPPGLLPDVDMDAAAAAAFSGGGGEGQRGRSLTRGGAGTPHPSHPDWLTRASALSKDDVKRNLKDALEVIVDARGSRMLRKKLREEAEQRFGMDLETAFGTLGVMRETDDEMVLAVFQTRCVDAPGMTDKMLDALRAIATARQSTRLLRFLETGNPEADAPSSSNGGGPVPLDWPRGLDQLGNTCYLNSLLQYFYTIRELRECVVNNEKLVDEQELSESGKLETMRVGGRLVTKREIARSAEFVRLLGVLFTQLSVAETPSVTPELQLAKLALVTSQDEEEDKQQSQPLVTSPIDTRQNTAPSSDATLVDTNMDGSEVNGTTVPAVDATALNSSATPLSTPAATPGAESASSPAAEQRLRKSSSPALESAHSVLGKRDRDSSVRPSRSMMDIDSLIDGGEILKSPKRANTLPPSDAAASLEPLSFKRAMTEPMEVDPVESKQRAASIDVEMKAQDDPSAEKQVNGVVDAAQPPEPPKRPPPLPPRSSTKRVEVQSDSFMMFGRQHDVSECMDNCMFQIEAALKPDEEIEEGSLVKRLFYGKLRQRVSSDSASSVHQRDDPFAHIHINVGDEGFDLYDGLGGYFEDEVEYEGRKSKMDVTLVELPQLLQVQLQRVQFNRETFQPYKSNAYVKFGETLYLDRFLETADPQKRERSIAIRKQLDECRNEIHALTQGKSGSFLEAMDVTRKFLDEQKQIDIPEWDSDVSKALESERQALSHRIEELRARAASLKDELEAVWANDQTAEYELCSVFIHRGNHSFGHYWLYARALPDFPDQWFKYNDSTITSVNKSEVLGDLTGSTANPYLLVYAKKGSDAIQTVHRLM